MKNRIALRMLGTLAACAALNMAADQTLSVTNSSDSGPGSFRQAIHEANALPGRDTIVFALPQWSNSIALATPLPPILAPVVIDGWSQPNFAGIGAVEITGALITNSSPGLDVQTSNCIVRGLVINRFKGAGIRLQGGDVNRIEGNVVGLDLAGDAARENIREGIVVVNSSFNLITGNLISGNGGHGISLAGASVGNVIKNNRIGTNLNGDSRRANGGDGIRIEGQNAHSNLIGGATPGDGNLLSGNGGCGVFLDNCATNTIAGNMIGCDANGRDPLYNSQRGILLVSGARDNTIGGSEPGSGNRVAFNTHGVVLADDCGLRNAVLGNLIYANRHMGLDVGGDGPTTNDVMDADSGPNSGQNFPLITNLEVTPSGTRIAGSLASKADTRYRVELFADHYTASTGHGRDQTFLGKCLVETDAGGFGSFQTNLAMALDPMDLVMVTATDPEGNTSEFSPAVWVTPIGGAISNSFDSGDFGWTVWKSEVNRVISPEWNPSGWITYDDNGGDGHTAWWRAPSNFVALASTALGGYLEFEIRQSSTDNQYGSADVVLTGGGITLGHRLTSKPGSRWTRFRVPLDDRGGWFTDGGKAQPGSMRQVLAALSILQIRAEHRTGGDEDNLDNVRLLLPPPTLALLNDADGLRLLWPGWAQDFELETTPYAHGSHWQRFNANQETLGVHCAVTVPRTNQAQFFRLTRKELTPRQSP